MKEETNFYLESIIKEINGIKITVDFRTELLGIIMIIGNYKEKYPFGHKAMILFSPFPLKSYQHLFVSLNFSPLYFFIFYNNDKF